METLAVDTGYSVTAAARRASFHRGNMVIDAPRSITGVVFWPRWVQTKQLCCLVRLKARRPLSPCNVYISLLSVTSCDSWHTDIDDRGYTLDSHLAEDDTNLENVGESLDQESVIGVFLISDQRITTISQFTTLSPKMRVLQRLRDQKLASGCRRFLPPVSGVRLHNGTFEENLMALWISGRNIKYGLDRGVFCDRTIPLFKPEAAVYFVISGAGNSENITLLPLSTPNQAGKENVAFAIDCRTN